jgi:hypothetical protein
MQEFQSLILVPGGYRSAVALGAGRYTRDQCRSASSRECKHPERSESGCKHRQRGREWDS